MNLEEIKKKKVEELKEKMTEEKIDKPIEVTADNFDSLVRQHKFILIDCWSMSCPPCMMLGPIIEELASEHAGEIVFGKLSFDQPQNQKIAARYGIEAIPTMLIFKDGKHVDTFIGLMSKEILESKLGLGKQHS